MVDSMAFGKVQRSAELFKQAWSVLRSDPALMLFPIISAAATLAVLASFAIPVLLSPELQGSFESLGTDRAKDASADPAASPLPALLLMFAFYFVTSFVTIFFNAALLGAADLKFRGEPTGVSAGLKVAISRLPQILAWTVVSAVIGTVLRAIEERVGIVGRIMIAFAGAAWAIASYFAIPAIVVDGVGPIEALRRTVRTIKATWGEGLVVAIGFGFIGFLISMLAALLIVGGACAGVVTGSWALGGAILLAGIVLLLAWAVVATTLRSIVQMALYRYAVNGAVSGGFEQHSLQAAFAKK
jgi:hypothetical protein